MQKNKQTPKEAMKQRQSLNPGQQLADSISEENEGKERAESSHFHFIPRDSWFPHFSPNPSDKDIALQPLKRGGGSTLNVGQELHLLDGSNTFEPRIPPRVSMSLPKCLPSTSDWTCLACGMGNSSKTNVCFACPGKKTIPMLWMCSLCGFENSKRASYCLGCNRSRVNVLTSSSSSLPLPEKGKKGKLTTHGTDYRELLFREERNESAKHQLEKEQWTCGQCTLVQSLSFECCICRAENPFFEEGGKNFRQTQIGFPIKQKEGKDNTYNHSSVGSSSNNSSSSSSTSSMGNSNINRTSTSNTSQSSSNDNHRNTNSYSLCSSITFAEEIAYFGSFWCDRSECLAFNAKYATKPRYQGSGVFRLHCSTCNEEQSGTWVCVECQNKNKLKRVDPKHPTLHTCENTTCSYFRSGTYAIFISYEENHYNLERGKINQIQTQEYWQNQSRQCQKVAERERLQAEFICWFDSLPILDNPKLSLSILQSTELESKSEIEKKQQWHTLHCDRGCEATVALIDEVQKEFPTLQHVRKLVESNANIFYRDGMGNNLIGLFFNSRQKTRTIIQIQAQTKAQTQTQNKTNASQIPEWEKIAFYFIHQGVDPFVCTDLGVPQQTPWLNLNSFFFGIQATFNIKYFLDWMKDFALRVNENGKMNQDALVQIHGTQLYVLIFEYSVGDPPASQRTDLLRWMKLLMNFIS